MLQRRSEERFMCADLVKIQVGRGRKRTHETVANLEDISPSGACLQLETAVQEGADVQILCARCKLRGKIKYCRLIESGYCVGVEFNKPKSWTLRRFKPRHFLDIALLGISITGQGKQA
ncbi:MAG TPA: PilZ domain-containing protein [Bryobacteraceae bacterium]|jgi:c-di-GMP-binding flagellar brake protein YcgR|nr:PilZ domain-containing protein [Bryobacteraceae bacterium]